MIKVDRYFGSFNKLHLKYTVYCDKLKMNFKDLNEFEYSLGDPLIRAENKVVTFKPSKPEQVRTCVGKWRNVFLALLFVYTKLTNHFPIRRVVFLSFKKAFLMGFYKEFI
jgi:hypothetical protein